MQTAANFSGNSNWRHFLGGENFSQIPSQKNKGQVGHAKKRILVIEDSKLLLGIYADALRTRGYDVVTAKNVAEADALIANSRFDAEVVDIKLPDGSGLGLVEKFRQRQKDAFVIVVSAVTDSDTHVAALKCGALTFMKKPISPQELSVQVDTLFARQPAAAPGQAAPLPSVAPELDSVTQCLQRDQFERRLTKMHDEIQKNSGTGNDSPRIELTIINLSPKSGDMDVWGMPYKDAIVGICDVLRSQLQGTYQIIGRHALMSRLDGNTIGMALPTSKPILAQVLSNLNQHLCTSRFRVSCGLVSPCSKKLPIAISLSLAANCAKKAFQTNRELVVYKPMVLGNPRGQA